MAVNETLSIQKQNTIRLIHNQKTRKAYVLPFLFVKTRAQSTVRCKVVYSAVYPINGSRPYSDQRVYLHLSFLKRAFTKNSIEMKTAPTQQIHVNIKEGAQANSPGPNTQMSKLYDYRAKRYMLES